MNTYINNYSKEELTNLVKALKYPAFRAKQIYEWLYIHTVDSYDQMTNLPKDMRSNLAEHYPIYKLTPYHVAKSTDGTRKYIFKLEDGAYIEAVGIPSQKSEHLTVCFSTQVGCAMACAFCATGEEGFTRNLNTAEIVEQILFIQKDFNKRVSNIVGMGQGEPFLNYEALLKALRILNDPKGIAIGARHITISTCGIIPGINAFAKEPEQFTLAISLHNAIQEQRDKIMPKMGKMDLISLKKALKDYIQKTNRRVTFEYIMIKDTNDTEKHLDALLDFCSGLLCHVNFLPVNPIEGSTAQPSSTETINKWINELRAHGVESTIRNSRGKDIHGACGQLKNHLLDK